MKLMEALMRQQVWVLSSGISPRRVLVVNVAKGNCLEVREPTEERNVEKWPLIYSGIDEDRAVYELTKEKA